MASKHPQAEQLVLDWLKTSLTEQVFTETDDSLTAPAFRVQVFGGTGGTGANQLTRSPSVELSAYAKGRGAALDLLEKGDLQMMALSSSGFAGRYVDDVRLTFYPSVEPYMNTGLHQATATYAIDLRPQK